jgi:hypothetical protein
MSAIRCTIELLLIAILTQLGAPSLAAPAPSPAQITIIAVTLDAPAPEKHLALVLDVSGELRDGKSDVIDDDGLRRLLQPPKATEPVRYVKLTVADEDKTSVAKLTKALTRIRAAVAKEGETTIAVHLKNLKPKKP